MPIASFMNGARFDRETMRVMGVAFEMTRIALGLADRSDQANELVATRIIELIGQAQSERDNKRNLAKSERKEAHGDTYQQERVSHVGARGRRESSSAMGGKNATRTTARGRKSARARKEGTGASSLSGE
jgi:hypothetical protein